MYIYIYIYIIMYICTVFSVYFFVLFYPPIFKHGSSLVFSCFNPNFWGSHPEFFAGWMPGSNWHGFPHSSPFLVPSFLWIFPWFSYGFSMIIHVFPVEFPMAFLSWLVQLLRSARAERGCKLKAAWEIYPKDVGMNTIGGLTNISGKLT